LTHDKENSIFDTQTIVVIFLAIVLVAVYIYAKNLRAFTSGLHGRDVEFHASVEERIRPFGRIKLPGDEHAPGELKVDEVPQAEPVATLMSGPQVFNAACIACHGTGIGGAPMLEDGAAWEPRIAQGIDTLYLHSLEGYTGTMGYMPPKGARLDLSDKEVSDAVDYMLTQVPNQSE
jgi:cytochrome c5